MVKDFTCNELVAFLYNELSSSDAVDVIEKIHADPVIEQEYKLLKKAKQALPVVTFYPGPSTVDRILKYSRESAPEMI